MKILGRMQSKQGHAKLDYLCTFSEQEIKALKYFLIRRNDSPKRKVKDGSPEYNVLVSMTKVLTKITNSR